MYLNRGAGYTGLPEQCGVVDCPSDDPFYDAVVYRNVGIQDGVVWSMWIRNNRSTFLSLTQADAPGTASCFDPNYEPYIRLSYAVRDGAQDFWVEFRTSEPPFDLVVLDDVTFLFADIDYTVYESLYFYPTTALTRYVLGSTITPTGSFPAGLELHAGGAIPNPMGVPRLGVPLTNHEATVNFMAEGRAISGFRVRVGTAAPDPALAPTDLKGAVMLAGSFWPDYACPPAPPAAPPSP